jgi:diguanylate cyclase (GGDEF)-like protein/PAS domain S-box-containing protein
VAPAVVVCLAGGVLWMGSASLRAAEKMRLADRSRLVVDLARYVSETKDLAQVRQEADNAGFVPTQPALDSILLTAFTANREGDTNALVALIRDDGTILGTQPPGALVPSVTSMSATWRSAVGGSPAMSPVLSYRGSVAAVKAVPVGGAHPWGVLIEVAQSAHLLSQGFVSKIGSLGLGPGGGALVDPAGRALEAWDPQLVGKTLVGAGALRHLRTGAATAWTTSGRAQTVDIGVAVGFGYALLFQQRASDLYSDLLSEQSRWDLEMFAVLGVAVAALVALSWWRQRTRRRLARRLRALLQNSQDLVLVVDRVSGRLTFVSPAARALLGRSPADLRGRSMSEIVDPSSLAGLDQLFAGVSGGNVRDPGGTLALLDVAMTDSSGRLQWFDLEAKDLSQHPDVGGVLLTCHEAGRRKALQEELDRQVRHDPLTGLPNRSVFHQRLDEAAAGGGPLQVLLLDLDHFKPVNNRLGHDAGDQVLCEVAARLLRQIGDAGVVCRFGGDEFGVVMRSSTRAATTAAETLVRAVSFPIDLVKAVVNVGASVGVACWPGGASAPPGILVRAADQAMYQAKRAGGGRSVTEVVSVGAADESNKAGGIGAFTYAISESGVPTQPRAVTGAAGSSGTERLVAAPQRFEVPLGGTARRGRTWRQWGSTLLPLVASIVVIAGVAGAEWIHDNQAISALESRRVAERLTLTAGVASYISSFVNPSKMLQPISSLPWSLSSPGIDAPILLAVTKSPLCGPDASATLVSADGQVLATEPAGSSQPFTTDDPEWKQALTNQDVLMPLARVGGVSRSYLLIPVVNAGQVAAVVVIGDDLRTSWGEQLFKTGGSLGFGSGGILTTDRSGRVVESWDPSLIGRPFVDPAALSAVPVGRAREVRGPRGSLTLVSPVASYRNPDPFYAVFSQPESALFADLRQGSTARNLSLLGLVVAALALMAFAGWRREQTVRKDGRRLDALLHNAQDIVAVVSADGSPTFISSAYAGLLGYDSFRVTAQVLLDVVHPEDRERLTGLQARVREGGTTHFTDLRLRTVTGEYRYFDVEATDLRHHRDVRGILLTLHEASQRHELQEQLEYQADHDLLTGLLNRGAFTRQLETVSATARSGTYAVLFIDLDHFKPINDAFGHDTGDQVLRRIAARLTGAVRDHQDEREADTVCRVGGDEFAILLMHADVEQARGVAQRVVEALEQPIEIDGHRVGVTATVGVSFSQPGCTPERVVRRADRAMYQGKQAGRGQYWVYEPESAGALD